MDVKVGESNVATGVVLLDPATGLPYAAGGGAGGGGAGTPVVDNAGVRWLWIYDKDTATSTYISFTTGAAGTPTFPITPDADTSVQVSGTVTTSPNITRGSGVVDANTQRVTLATDGPVVTSIGATSDAAATTDTGSFSILAFIKRGLQNWTTLLSRVPSLIGGRIPVEPLGLPGVARQQATTTASANIALTSGVVRISLFARSSPLRYSVGAASQTANAATSHYLASGERIDIDVPTPTANIAVIRASDATADGAAEITELS